MWFGSYVHILDGRVRIKLKAVKGSTDLAASVEQSLLQTKGINEVNANPTTGNVLILFDPSVITCQKVLRLVNELAGSRNVITFPSTPAIRASQPKQPSRFDAVLSNLILQAAAEVVVKRLVLAFL